MKQQELSGLLGISRGSLANIETGRQGILIHSLYKIASALELSPFDLLPDELPEVASPSQSQLPLPDNLKAEQKEQVTNLFLRLRRPSLSKKRIK